jgi:hypothetical protein
VEKKIVLVFLTLLILISCSKETQVEDEQSGLEKGRFQDNWTYNVFIENNVNNSNTFKLWVPQDVKPRAILVLSVGGGGNGTNMVNNPDWKAFAIEEKLALVGTHIKSNYEEAAQNLKFAVSQISEARGLENMVGLPYLLRGHSAGGRFSYDFSKVYPVSTIAWSNIKGTLTPSDQTLPPGLFIVGEDDLLQRNQSIESSFLKQRKNGSICVFALEPNAGHGAGSSDPLIRTFFSSILNKTFDGTGSVSSIDATEVLLGNNQTLEFWPFAEYPGNKEEASCLIDESFAEAWVDFMTE